jgi:mono/diheme cytochrome c family protein
MRALGAARAALAVVVVLVMGAAILGIGMGDAPKPEDPAPKGAALTASKQRIASGSASVKAGAQEYEAHGCDSCHAIAAGGSKGVLGPRLDTLADDDVKGIVGDITDPRDEIVPGYEANLMPDDYAKEMSSKEIREVADYIKAASGDEPKGKGKGKGDGDEG